MAASAACQTKDPDRYPQYDKNVHEHAFIIKQQCRVTTFLDVVYSQLHTLVFSAISRLPGIVFLSLFCSQFIGMDTPFLWTWRLRLQLVLFATKCQKEIAFGDVYGSTLVATDDDTNNKRQTAVKLAVVVNSLTITSTWFPSWLLLLLGHTVWHGWCERAGHRNQNYLTCWVVPGAMTVVASSSPNKIVTAPGVEHSSKMPSRFVAGFTVYLDHQSSIGVRVSTLFLHRTQYKVNKQECTHAKQTSFLQLVLSSD